MGVLEKVGDRWTERGPRNGSRETLPRGHPSSKMASRQCLAQKTITDTPAVSTSMDSGVLIHRTGRGEPALARVVPATGHGGPGLHGAQRPAGVRFTEAAVTGHTLEGCSKPFSEMLATVTAG